MWAKEHFRKKEVMLWGKYGKKQQMWLALYTSHLRLKNALPWDPLLCLQGCTLVSFQEQAVTCYTWAIGMHWRKNRKHQLNYETYEIQAGQGAPVRRWNTTVRAMYFKDHRLKALISTKFIPLLHIILLQNRPSVIIIGKIWAIPFWDTIFLSFLENSTGKKNLFSLCLGRLNTGQGNPGWFFFFFISKGLPLNWTRNKRLLSCLLAPFSYCWFLENLQCSMSPLRFWAFSMIRFIMWTECTVQRFLVFPV